MGSGSDKPEDRPGDKPGSGQDESTRAHLLDSVTSKLPQKDHLKTTLYDMARTSLTKRGALTGEREDNDSIYRELNRIMTLNGYKTATLDGKNHISDADLPRTWNSVVSRQEFKIYGAARGAGQDGKSEPPAAESSDGKTSAQTEREKLIEQLRRKVIDETSTLPLLRGEGYYQVLERMHPGTRAEDLVKEAHRIKHINSDRDILYVGERLATATQEERQREVEKRLKELDDAAAKNGSTPPAPGDKKDEGGDGKKPAPPAADGDRQADRSPPPGKKEDKPADESGSGKDKDQPGKEKGGEQKEPPKPATPGGPPSPLLSMDDAWSQLNQQHGRIVDAFNRTEKAQGFIGNAFDATKNAIGTSATGKAWYSPANLWSHVFDSDLGSQALSRRFKNEADKLEQLHQAVGNKDEARFKAIYKDLTGKDFDPSQKAAAQLASARAVPAFDESQKHGVDGVTDAAAAILAASTLRLGGGSASGAFLKATAKSALLGGAVKAGLMQADGRYARLPRDFAVGAVMSATVPIGELAGSQVSRSVASRYGLTVTGDLLTSRIETQGMGIGTRLLSAASKSGVSGGVFGALESPGRQVVEDLEAGKRISVTDLLGKSVTGGVFGFAGGTVLGGMFDGMMDGFRTLRPGKVVAGATIEGVKVPSSGVVGLDDAGAMLKMKPGEFARKAASDPYAAVEDAAKLYEKTGLNVGKAAALKGEGPVPEKFVDALNTVQNVDALTADAAMPLKGKVQVVRTTDAYLQANSHAVDESFSRIAADPNYREVVRLKGETGPQAAEEFEKGFRSGFEKDLKTSMAVERVNNKGLSEADALARTQSQAESAYKQKAADFFKDMTDPAQRTRLNGLVDDIYAKFNPEMISRADLQSIIEGVPEADRQLAVALLQESAGLSSDSILRARLQAVRSDLEKITGSSGSNVYTLAPDSSGNLLGYLYRKSNSMHMSMNNLDKLASDVASGHVPGQVVLFDDLSSTTISQADKELLKKIPKVYVVDVGAFEKGVNVIDMSQGKQAITAKLDQLLAEAHTVRALPENSGLLPTGIARETLSGAVDKAAADIGPNVKVIRPSGTLSIPNVPDAKSIAAMSDLDGLYAQLNVPKASREEIAGFLSGYAGDEREMAAKMLADGAVHNSFPTMVKKAVSVYSELKSVLGKGGASMDDLVLVSDKDPGGSTHLVSYLFGKVNGLSKNNFVSSQQLDKIIASKAAGNKVVAYFDDTIYSGAQTTGMLNSNISSLKPFKRVVIGSLGAYQQGIDAIKGTHLAQLGKVDVASAAVHHPFYSSQHPLYSRLTGPQQWMVKKIGGSEGFGSVQGSLIWAYMYPDNNLTFFGSKFSGGVLRLPGP